MQGGQANGGRELVHVAGDEERDVHVDKDTSPQGRPGPFWGRRPCAS
jgi:hypothetical protein